MLTSAKLFLFYFFEKKESAQYSTASISELIIDAYLIFRNHIFHLETYFAELFQSEHFE